MSGHLHGFFPTRIYLGIRARNKFKILDLFMSVNLYFKPYTDHRLGAHQYL
jgi:hypothetical protein